MTSWRLLTWTRSSGLKQLKSEYAIKAGLLGPEPELSKEIKILNRSIRWCGDKMEYEADSWHAEMIIEECEAQSWRAAKTLGVQEAAVDGSEKGGVQMNDHERRGSVELQRGSTTFPWTAATLSLRQRNFVVRWPNPNPRIAKRPEESRGVLEFPFEQRNEKLDGFDTATGQARGPP